MLHSPITLQTASDGTDVFISYRRSTGSQLARWVLRAASRRWDKNTKGWGEAAKICCAGGD